MGRFLVLTTDLPYFPGRNGHDHFNLRELAAHHAVAVVGPQYDRYPAEGLGNLSRFLVESYFWPRSLTPPVSFAEGDAMGPTGIWLQFVPRLLARVLARRLIGLGNWAPDAYEKLAILSNCAPYLHKALTDGHWHGIILIQSSLEPWLHFLPATGGKLVYFHDVRSDYLRRANVGPVWSVQLRKVLRQEMSAVQQADVSGFVSELDQQRAVALLGLEDGRGGVAPIPVDTSYFFPRQSCLTAGNIEVLFTGHLSHPPNVDAVLYFIRDIWPRVLESFPTATFVVVGMIPSEELKMAVASSPSCRLHADVPDIRPYFGSASAYVVPMRFGGGVRQKIFEAWSMEVPVVCTTMAAEGTQAMDGVHCLLADAAEVFAAAIVRVLKGNVPPVMVSAAKSFVEERYSLAAATPKFRKLAERAVFVKASKPFKLLFDLRWMELGKAGGMEQATYELISSLARLDQRNEYRFFVPRQAYHEWKFPDRFRARPFYSDYNGRRVEAHRSFFANQFAARGGLPQIMNRSLRSLAMFREMDFDLVHAPCGYLHPDLDAFPSVLTVHDLQHVHQPQFFASDAWKEREELYRASVARARHVICISEFTRQDLHRCYGVPLEKMTTIWNTPDRNAWRLLAANDRDRLIADMGIEGSYFFFPAQSWPHKNHARLISAFESVLDGLPKNMKLVLTGRPFAPDHLLSARIKEGRLHGRVVHLGFRTPVQVRALFQRATALVFPSLFEGFGIPLAEAMIAGTPIACSNVCSMPEVARDAAIYFDPKDESQIARALMRLAHEADLREHLRVAGLSLSRTFSAQDCALRTLGVYHRVFQELYEF